MDRYITSDVPFASQIEDIQKYISDFEKSKRNSNHIINNNGYSNSHNLRSMHNFPNHSNQNQPQLNQYKNSYQNLFHSSRNSKYKGNNYLNSSKGSYPNTNDNITYPSKSKLRRNFFPYNSRDNKNSENNITNNSQVGGELGYNSIRHQNLNTSNQLNNTYPAYYNHVSDMNMNQNINNFSNFQQITDWDKYSASFGSKKALMIKSLYDTYSHDVMTNKFDPCQAVNTDHNMNSNYNNKNHHSVFVNNSLYLNNTQQLFRNFPGENFNDKVDFLMTNSNLTDTNTFQYNINSSRKDIFNSPLNNHLTEKSHLSNNFTNSSSPISNNETNFNNNISPISSNIIMPTNDSMTYMNNSSQSRDCFMPYPSDLYTSSSTTHYYNGTDSHKNQKISLLQHNIYDYKNGSNDTVSAKSFGWGFTDIKDQTGIDGNNTILSIKDTNKNISLPNLNKSFKIWNDDMKVWS